MEIVGGRVLGWHGRMLVPERGRVEAVLGRVRARRTDQEVVQEAAGRTASGTYPSLGAHHRDPGAGRLPGHGRQPEVEVDGPPATRTSAFDRDIVVDARYGQ